MATRSGSWSPSALLADILNATVNEIEAQSGKTIPSDTAQRWISVIERIEVLIESELSARGG